MVNAAEIRRKSQKSQRKALNELRPAVNGAIFHPRPAASSHGVRQVTSLAKLPTIAKTITIKDGEVQLCWRLKCEDARALKMMLLIYEANGWIVET